MTTEEFSELIKHYLPYAPNEQQQALIGALARFCGRQPEQAVTRYRTFVLNGYAGTGKTSLTGALVKALREQSMSVVLLAPTGRAAKVFSSYAGQRATTIHRRIYRHSMGAEFSGGRAPMQDNTAKDTLFIVDEASMIGGGDEQGSNLLEDLIHYVFAGENCRLLLLGDTAQLPPVGSDFSPAMNTEVLRSYGLSVSHANLTATARQGSHSGILYNATTLRRHMRQNPLPLPLIITEGFSDVVAVNPEDLPEMIDGAYRRDGLEETVLITRSNRRAVEFNRAIRTEVLYYEEELRPDELLIVSRNNYHWARGVKGLDFIANGDILSVRRIYGTEARYGLRFADVRLGFPDDAAPEFDAKILLDSLHTDSVVMSRESYERLYYGLMNDRDLFEPTASAEERMRKLRTDPYWNALIVKYAYAVTCHKAQGGQWKNVFVDLSYIPPESMGMDFYRWLYTAQTRARSCLYLINPPVFKAEEGLKNE
ncbi:MAG: AAA family ATPase [Muribaculaceae bacterium]|nr:AAA family ATPase [Muribaculaceae bacterium]